MADTDTNITLRGPGPHNLPTIIKPGVRIHSGKEFVGIEGETLDPKSNRPTGIYVRLTLPTKDALTLLSTLLAMARGEGFEIPSGETEIHEVSPDD